MNHFERLKPTSIGEAVSLLSAHGEKARIVAGGTDILVQMKKRVSLPEYLISVEGIKGLDYIVHDKEDGLRIGPMTKITSIEKSSLIKSRYHALYQAAGKMATPLIRSRATIGGNLCNAAPSAETATPLIVMGAIVKIEGSDGSENVSLEDFFTGPGMTVLTDRKVLIDIRIPNLPPNSGSVYLKHTRAKGHDLAAVGVAALVVMDGETIKDVKIGLGAVAPTPIRAKKAEEILKGKRPDDTVIQESGQAAALESRPIDDLRSSAEYRRKMVAVLVKRAVGQAIQQMKG